MEQYLEQYLQEICSYLNSNPWRTVIGFAIVQLYFFISTRKKLSKFKGYFPKSKNWKVETDENVSAIHVDKPSAEFKTLVDEINEYLEKNEGTTDFGIIKDKVQSRLEALYEDATSKVSFPTYLGLMGTFFGVWIGLQSFKSGLDIEDGGLTDEAVSALIGGIIISMLTSLLGILLMMWSNAEAGSALKKVEEDKNEFFDFIQVQLMPVLGTSMVSALNKLHRTINTFEPAFRGVIGEFKTAFSECTETLRDSFGDKVRLLTSAVEAMGKNMSLINENVKMQDQLIKTMKQKGTLKTLDRFVAASEQFETVTTSIERLTSIKDEIAESSIQLINAQSHFNKQLVIPERIFEKICVILDRISTFEDSVNGLGVSISQTQLLGNSQMNLIQEQITAIQKKTDLAVSYQELADEELKEIYRHQTQAINSLNEKYRSAIESHGDDFIEVMNDFKIAYDKIVQECKEAVEAKRDEYIAEIRKSLDLEANNKYLANLGKMPELVAQLSSIKSDVKVQPDISDKVSKMSEQIQGVRQVLDSMNKKISEPHESAEKKGIWPFGGGKKK